MKNESINIEKVWASVKGKLRFEFGDAAYKSWLKPLEFMDCVNGELKITAPTKFISDWIKTHYLDQIKFLWSNQDSSVKKVTVVFVERNQPRATSKEKQEASSGENFQPTAEYAATSSALGAPLNTKFTFENFIVGKPNELAFAAARRVAESDELPFNPLFLYGGVGLGKTHLMHAIAWQIRKRNPDRKIVYLSAEKFMYQFIKALRYKDTVSFKENFRNVDILMIDDVQFISGKESTQEEFFHTFNALVDQKRQVIISADKSPNDLEGIEERMRSRLGWGLVADIHPTTYELRLGILQSKVEKMNVKIALNILEFLAHKISSSVRELEGALNRLVAHSTLVGGLITIETAKELLHDILRLTEKKVTIDQIQQRVAEHFNIKMTDMSSARRAQSVARPRQVAMYLCKQLTQRSLPEIGRKFGNRDHTTVIHAVKKVESLRTIDSSFDEDIELLHRMFGT